MLRFIKHKKLKQNLVHYYGEAQHQAGIEAQEKENKENNYENVIKVKTRYTKERTMELAQCLLIRDGEKFNPFEKEQAEKKEKRIKEETIEPDKLEGKYLTPQKVNENMRKLYSIMGKDWDKIKEEERTKEDEAKKAGEKGATDKKTTDAEVKTEEVSSVIKFDKVERSPTDSIDNDKDPKVKEAALAIQGTISLDTGKKEYKSTEELGAAIQQSINNCDSKFLLALAGKEMKLKAGNYNIEFKFLKPGESTLQKLGVEYVSVNGPKLTAAKKEEPKPKNEEKPKEELNEKELKELKEKIASGAKEIFESYAKMSKAEIEKNGLNKGLNLSYELSVKLNNLALQLGPQLSKLTNTIKIDAVFPNTESLSANQNGIYTENLSRFILNLYKEKNIIDKTEKETKNAFEYLKTFNTKTKEVKAKFEDKQYITQLGITSFDDYVKKFDEEVSKNIGTIDKKLIDKIEFNKLDFNTLSSSLNALVYFRLEKNKPIQLLSNLGQLRAMWDQINPTEKKKDQDEEKKSEEKPKEKVDLSKLPALRLKTQQNALKIALSQSLHTGDPLTIKIAIEHQFKKLSSDDQWTLPTDHMTPEGVKFQVKGRSVDLKIKITGVTEELALKNPDKWKKIPKVDVYGTPLPTEKKKEDTTKPELTPEELKTKEVMEKYGPRIKQAFDKFNSLSKEDIIAQKLNSPANLLHSLSNELKIAEKDLKDIQQLDKTYFSNTLIPGVDVSINKGGVNIEKAGVWMKNYYQQKGIEAEKDKTPNASIYMQQFSGKLIELKDLFSSKTYLDSLGVKSYEEMAKQFQEKLESNTASLDTSKIEWKDLPGETLVYPNYSYASFRLKKGEKTKINVNEAGMRTLWDKANEGKQKDEKAQEDSPEKIEKAKKDAVDKTQSILKKYSNMKPEELKKAGLNNRTMLLRALMNDFSGAQEDYKKNNSELLKTYETETTVNKSPIHIDMNKMGFNVFGLEAWMKNIYQEKKITDTESKETPKSREAEKKIHDVIRTVNEKYGTSKNLEDIAKMNIKTYGDYYKQYTDELTKGIQGLGLDIYKDIEWSKLPENTFSSGLTFFVEVSMKKEYDKPKLKFNEIAIKNNWDKITNNYSSI